VACSVRSPVNERFRLAAYRPALVHVEAHSQAVDVAQVVQKQRLVVKMEAAQRVRTFQRPTRRFQM